MSKTANNGKTLKRIGIFFAIMGSLLGTVLGLVPDSEMNDELFIIIFLSIIMLFGGSFLFWRGRQYAARSSAERIIGDSKPDVLYLRAFKTDRSAGMVTEEEQLGEVMQPFGDLVAIGKPGENLPTPGAARLYASDEEWKNVVIAQMQAARVVIFRAGIGEGLLWEFEQAVKVLDPVKLLILFLNMKKKHYNAFRKEMDQIFECVFPKADDIKHLGMISGFMRFSANWKPTFLPFRVSSFKRDMHKPYRQLYQIALRPVFEEFGLDWQPPPVSILNVSTILLLISFGLLVLLFMDELFF